MRVVENQLLTPKLYVVGRHRRPKTTRFSTKIVESEVCPPIFGACGAPWGAEEAEIGRELAFSPENTLNSRVITLSDKHPHFTREVTRDPCESQGLNWEKKLLGWGVSCDACSRVSQR